MGAERLKLTRAEQRAAWRLRERIRASPQFYVREVLGQQVWSKQSAILSAVRDSPRVAVQSGNNVGKSFTAACAVLWWLAAYPGGKVVTTATTWAQVESVLWTEIASLHARAKVHLGGRVLKTQLQASDADPGWVALGLSTNRSDSFVGRHAEHLLVVFDEAQGIEPEFWEAAETLASSVGCRILAIGNPVRTRGRFHEVCTGRAGGWEVLRISCLDHPNIVQGRDPETGRLPIPAAVSPEYVEAKRREWGERDPRWIARIEGRFPADGDDLALVPRSLLERTAATRPVGVAGRRLGVDVAREGSDESVACLLVNGVVAAMHSWREPDLMRTAALVLRMMRSWEVPAHCVTIDVGMGAGVADRLRQLGEPVRTLHFGSRALGDWARIVGRDMQFANRRSELFWVVRRALEAGLLSIPARWDELWLELEAIRYDHDRLDRLYVTPKDELRSVLGRSIDHADALVCALAVPPDQLNPFSDDAPLVASA